MDRNKYYKYMFLSGAIWNWAVGILFTLLSIFLLPTLASLFGLLVPPSLIFVHSFLALVFAVGVGLFIISRDITKNHGIAQMCVVEKFLIFIVILVYFFLGDCNIFLVIPVIVDLIYGILFLEFAINVKK